MDKPDFVKEIVKNKTHCYFISPHLDDAIFSSGELMAYLSNKVPVTVINVFTNAGDNRNTLSAKAFLKQSGFGNPDNLFKLRIGEDKRAMSSLGINSFYLGFTDALWRKTKRKGWINNILSKISPEFNRVYPTYRFNVISGKISSHDNEIKKEIKKKLKLLIESGKNFQVFCPIGFGNHVDHLLVREACQEMFKGGVIYWGDFPYWLTTHQKNKFISENSLAADVIPSLTDRKKDLFDFYQTQVKQVITGKTKFYEPELFFTDRLDKDNLQTKISYEFNKIIFKEWKDLWNKSDLRHYFNSPFWYLACQATFNYSKSIFIKCYKEDRLVGLIPLVLTKRYGISTYDFPGEQYLDKSSLLIIEKNEGILIHLIEALSKVDNFYLSGIEEFSVRHFLQKRPSLKYSKSSNCLYLPLLPDAFRYLDSKHKRPIKSIILKNQTDLQLKMFGKNTKNVLSLVNEIESASNKIGKNKNVFSDHNLIKLCLGLEKYQPGTLLTNVLYFKNNPVSYQFGFLYNTTFHLFQIAYKTSFANLLPGKVLLYLILPNLLKIGIRTLDFSRGETRFKKDFAPYAYRQYSVYYSNSKFVVLWWSTVNYLMHLLERQPKLFETVRSIKYKLLDFKKEFTISKRHIEIRQKLNFIFSKLTNKKIILFFLFFITSLLMLALVKGKVTDHLYYQTEKDLAVGGPFESSNSTSRYALTESIVKYKTFILNYDLAKFSSPDVSKIDNKYFSIFTPGVSFAGVPLYIIGSYYHIPQLSTYLLNIFIALINGYLIFLLAKKISGLFYPSLLSALTFLFATNALSYSLTFTQHHLSTMIILLALLNALKERSIYKNIELGLLFGLNILMDIPNFFMMLPVILFVINQHFKIVQNHKILQISLNTKIFLLILGLIPLLGLFGWYNYQITNSYTTIGQIIGRSSDKFVIQAEEAQMQPVLEKTRVAPFSQPLIATPFSTREQLQGLYILLFSDERGWLYYSPVVLFGFIGLWLMSRNKKSSILSVIFAIILIDILIYSMFGDPWGGWAFGPRYLMPATALACIFIGIAVNNFLRNFLFVTVFFILLSYSVRINTLGAVTTNAIPPKMEAINLNKPLPFTYKYNFQLINNGFSSSLFYNVFLKNKISPRIYLYIYSGIVLFLFFMIYLALISDKDRKD
jgi:hypothetical protein